MEILVTAHLSMDDAVHFEQAVVQLLRSYKAELCCFKTPDGDVILHANALGEAPQCVPADEPLPEPSFQSTPPPAAPPEEQPPKESDTIDLPIHDTEVPVTSGPDVTSDQIGLEPIPVLTGEVCLKDLSSLHAIPFHVDASKQYSELKVKELRDLEDHVAFVFCGMTFKFPIPPPISGVVNSPIPPTSQALRVMVEFVGHNDLMPVLFNLVECAENEPHCVIFGDDMANLVASVVEKESSEPIPTE